MLDFNFFTVLSMLVQQRHPVTCPVWLDLASSSRPVQFSAVCGIRSWCQLTWTLLSKMVCKYWLRFGNKSEQISLSALAWVYPNKHKSFVFKSPGTDCFSFQRSPICRVLIIHRAVCFEHGHWPLGKTPSQLPPRLKCWRDDFPRRVQFQCSWKQTGYTRALLSVGEMSWHDRNPEPTLPFCVNSRRWRALSPCSVLSLPPTSAWAISRWATKWWP